MKQQLNGNSGRNDFEVRSIAMKKLKALFPTGKPRFGDKRDEYLKALNTKEPTANPCISKGLSTMPRRAA